MLSFNKYKIAIFDKGVHSRAPLLKDVKVSRLDIYTQAGFYLPV